MSEGRFSQRRIAKRTGVSRAAIADGSRPDYEAQRRLRELRESEDQFQGPVQRCTGCGGMTQMQCRLCVVRQYRAEQYEAARRERKRIRERELRRLLLLQRAIALGKIKQFRRGAA